MTFKVRYRFDVEVGFADGSQEMISKLLSAHAEDLINDYSLYRTENDHIGEAFGRKEYAGLGIVTWVRDDESGKIGKRRLKPLPQLTTL